MNQQNQLTNCCEVDPQLTLSVEWKAVVDDLLNWCGNLTGWRILDYGCETEYAAAYLSKIVPSTYVHGVFASRTFLKVSRKQRVYDAVEVIKGSPVLNDARFFEQFDAVICGGMFTSINTKEDELKHLLSPLKIGGVLLLSARETYCRFSQFLELMGDLIRAGALERIYESHRDIYQTQLLSDDVKSGYWILRKLKRFD